MPQRITCHSDRAPVGGEWRNPFHSLAVLSVAFLSLAGLFFIAPGARAQAVGDFCFCMIPGDSDFNSPGACLDVITADQCRSADGRTGCEYFATSQECLDRRNALEAEANDGSGTTAPPPAGAIAVANSPTQSAPAAPTTPPTPKGKLLPKCILEDRLDKDSECRDVGIFIVLGINIANYLFGIVGALALLMFVYGGVLFIISSGNPEKVKKGIDAMVAAIIGLIVVFSAYLLVGFLGEVVGVGSQFKL